MIVCNFNSFQYTAPLSQVVENRQGIGSAPNKPVSADEPVQGKVIYYQQGPAAHDDASGINRKHRRYHDCLRLNSFSMLLLCYTLPHTHMLRSEQMVKVVPAALKSVILLIQSCVWSPTLHIHRSSIQNTNYRYTQMTSKVLRS